MELALDARSAAVDWNAGRLLDGSMEGEPLSLADVGCVELTAISVEDAAAELDGASVV